MSLISKIFVTLLIVIIISSCADKPLTADLAWMEGSWAQTSPKGAKRSLETWSVKKKQLLGKGYTLLDTLNISDTLFIESLKIFKEGDNWFYEADIPLQDPVAFKLTNTESDTWTFTNSQHDFPKIIIYEKTDNGMKTIVGDDQKKYELNFVKIQ